MISQALHLSAKERNRQADSQTLLRICHTCAHVLAMAVQTRLNAALLAVQVVD
ncbi:MAG: hypothetical protein K6T90_21890 [Leptolyngbyaceae cyanobacterium HOT.MB2.61]|nr:hypothetical protein [Leptolyngbyaceae cyanobacterium HOT.MB2.61]